MVQPGRRALQVQLARKVLLARPVRKVRRAFKATLAQQDQLALRGARETPGIQGPKVLKVIQGTLA